MESLERNSAYIFPPICTNRLILSKGAFFVLFILSVYANQPHNLSNLVFVLSSLLFSI